MLLTIIKYGRGLSDVDVIYQGAPGHGVGGVGACSLDSLFAMLPINEFN